MSSCPLILLVERGNLAAVKAFVEANPDSVKERSPETGRLPLHDLLAWWQNPLPAGASEIVSCDIAAFLIRAYPKALTEVDAEGNTPLHTIAKVDDYYYSEQFQLVYEGAKCVSGFRNAEGQLPIHVAIECGNHEFARILIEQDFCEMTSQECGLLGLAIARGEGGAFVHELVKKNPQSARITDIDGLLPIQFALTKGDTSPGVIRALADSHPGSLGIPDKDGELPLHIAAGYYFGQDQGDRVQVLQELGAGYPQAYSTANKKGELPLHLAIVHESNLTDDQSVEVLKEVTSGYARAHQVADCNGNLPLHVACSYFQNDLAIITYLLEQNPTVLQTVNYNGCFPLHLAARGDLPVSALNFLIKQFPRVLLMQDCEGNLPLHHAVFRDCFQVECVQLLLEKCPGSVLHTNLQGKLPLHLACMNFAPTSVIDLLIKYHPTALSCYDKEGRLPVHLTCVKRGMPNDNETSVTSKQVETIEHLLKKLKGSTALLPCTKDRTPPLFLACASDAPLEVILMLSVRSPELFSIDYRLNSGHSSENKRQRARDSKRGNGGALASKAAIGKKRRSFTKERVIDLEQVTALRFF